MVGRTTTPNRSQSPATTGRRSQMITEYGYISFGLLFIALGYLYALVRSVRPNPPIDVRTRIQFSVINVMLNIFLYLPVLWLALQSVTNLPAILGFGIVIQLLLTVGELITIPILYSPGRIAKTQAIYDKSVGNVAVWTTPVYGLLSAATFA